MGPTRVGPSGLIQPIADVLKLVSKEIIIPTNANKGIFLTAPMLMLIPSLLVWSVIPLSEYFVISNINADYYLSGTDIIERLWCYISRMGIKF